MLVEAVDEFVPDFRCNVIGKTDSIGEGRGL